MTCNSSRPKHCTNCPFSWGSTVGGKGNPEAPIVFVGESPSALELAKNELHIGDRGKVLRDCFPEGTTLDDYYMVNALQCMPPKLKDKKKSQTLLQQGCTSCRERLLDDIRKHPRKLIVALGNAALWSVTGNFGYKITQERGKIIPSDLAEIGVLASVHPSYLLHGGGHYRKFREDIEYGWKLLETEGAGTKKHIIPTWNVAEDEDDVIDFIDYMLWQAERDDDYVLGSDIETGGFNFMPDGDEILAWGLCVDPSEVFIFPEAVMPLVKKRQQRLTGHNRVRFVWHNGKFDCKFLNRDGIRVQTDEDTMLLNYTLDEVRGNHDLEQVASDVLGAPAYKDMLKPYLPKKGTSYRVIPKPVLYEYLAYDVSDTKQIYRILRERVRGDAASEKQYTRVMLPASELLADVEQVGIRVDMDKVNDNAQKLDKEIAALEAEMNGLVKEWGLQSINPRSPKQVADLLYTRMKLSITKKGTDEDTLDSLPQVPFVRALKVHRKKAKKKGTYVKPLMPLAPHPKTGLMVPNPKYVVYSDGCVHSSYLLHGTATGRLASKGPNMQNQPRDVDIKGQFVAGEGEMFMEMDLDQAELRCLTALSGDPALIKIYTTPGMSIHKDVSISLWGPEWADKYKIDTPGDPDYDEAKEQYMRTKALNFGIVYGREAPSIAEEFEVEIAEAQTWIDGWAKKFPKAWEYIDKCRMAPLRNQNLITPFGRRKRCAVVSEEKLKDLQNEAANFPHQSIASDITLVSACKVNKTLKSWNVHICNLIHDAILVRLPNDIELAKKVARYVTGEMEKTPIEWGITKVPFSADAKTGYRWGDLKGFDFK